MSYLLDEIEGDIRFEVKGNRLILRVKPEIFPPMGGGGGGSGIYLIKTNDYTRPTDQNAFSSLRTLEEIALACDNIIIDVNAMFLRKDIPDTAHGAITFDKKVGSSTYLSGMNGKGWEVTEKGNASLDYLQVRTDVVLAGSVGSPTYASGFTGWGVDIDMKTATAEMDNIFIRKTFTAYEIVYSQIYGLGGSQIVSDINKIGSVETLPDRYRCYMDDMDGLMLMNLRKGDGVRIQTRTGTTSIKYLMGRCIGVDSDYFDLAIPLLEGTGIPAAGDFATRWGNNEDKNRQGLIYLTTADNGAPFIDVYDGITGTSTEGCLKARLGNLSGLRTKNGHKLSGYGGYFNGLYLENSSIYTDTGETVEQRFVAMNGRFTSEIEGIRNDMSTQSGNLLRNASFTTNTHYWDTANEAHFINVGGQYLWMDGSFYVEGVRLADIVRDGTRNVLRLRNASISQPNELFTGKGKAGTHSIAFKYRVIRPGTLTVGFAGQELYKEIAVTASPDYQHLSVYGQWDGTGDFTISCTGEVYIQGVSFFNDLLADVQIKLQTQIDQTDEYIKLLATKEYVDKETGQIYTHYDSELLVTAEKISGISTKIDNVKNTIDTAGWITTAEGNKLFASHREVDSLTGRVSDAESSITNTAHEITLKVSNTDYNGETVTAMINQTAWDVTIKAEKIDLKGKVSFTMFDNHALQTINGKADSNSLGALAKMDTVKSAMEKETLIVGGYIKTELINTKTLFANMIISNGAKIGGFSIDSGRMSWAKFDYFGGKDYSIVLGDATMVIDRPTPAAIFVSTNNAGNGCGIASVIHGNGCAIYGSTDGYGSNTPSSSYKFAGYFSGSIKATGTCQAGVIVGGIFRFATEISNSGYYRYIDGISFDPVTYDLDTVRFRVRGGLIVGVTDDSGNLLQGT